MRRRLPVDTLSATLLPLVIWIVHLGLVYVLVSLTCARDLSTQVAWILVILFTLVAIGSVMLLSYLFLRKLKNATRHDVHKGFRFEGPGSPSFIGKTGLLTALLSLIAILWTALPLLIVSPCG